MNMFEGDTNALFAFGQERQGKRLLRLSFPHEDGPDDALMLVNTLDATEGLSRDFRFAVEVLSDDARIPLKAMMGKMVTIALVRDDGSLRYFNGYVFAFRFVKTDGGFACYHMTLKPWLAYLHLRQNSVAFQHKNAVELAGQLFADYPERDWQHKLTGDDPALTYEPQYNETDHNYLHRRLEALGVYYWYEHRADGHTLWLADDSSIASEAIERDAPEMPYRSQAGSKEDDSLHRWSPVRQTSSGSATVASFNFKHPHPARAQRASANDQGGVPAFDIYEDGGLYAFNGDEAGDALAHRRMQEIDARGQQFAAGGNDRTAQPGRWFRLSDHFSGDLGDARDAEADAEDKSERQYLILEVRHRAGNNYHTGRQAQSFYDNDFSCLPRDVPWRPGRGFSSAPARIVGVQTATVVGPEGEDIYTDGYGRVKVQFHWDRLGEFNPDSSPWIRAMSTWAGSNFGHISLPRVGMEVAVQFLDGNPARPLIIGCLYNAENMPPWDLPQSRTQSGMLTRSSTGGTGHNANALRFEDRKGEEEIWLHAEKDQRIEVEHDESHTVDHDRSKLVGNDETVQIGHDRRETVGNDETITVRRNRSERVDGDETIRIGANRNEDVGGNEDVRIGGNRSVTVGGNKTESVGLIKSELVGVDKLLKIGAGYQIGVGGAMQTRVGLSQASDIRQNKSIHVGKDFTIMAKDQFAVGVGSAALQMLSDGTIKLSGVGINITGSGPVRINGKEVDINDGGGTAASLASAPVNEAEPATSSSPTRTNAAAGDAVPPEPSPKIERKTDLESTLTAGQQATINSALDRQRDMLLQKKKELARWNADDQRNFYNAFGSTSEDSRAIIGRRVDAELDANSKFTVENFVDGPQPPGVSDNDYQLMHAYADPNDKNHIVHLGPQFWKDPDGGSDSRAGVISHEVSHFNDLFADCIPDMMPRACRTIDGAVDHDTRLQAKDDAGMDMNFYGAYRSSLLTPDEALYHADSFEYYLENKSLPRD